MGIDAGIGEAALADAAVKGGTDAAEGAAGGGLLDALGLGSLFGGGAAADAGAASLADFAGSAGLTDALSAGGIGDLGIGAGAGAAAFDPGIAAGDLAFLGGGGGGDAALSFGAGAGGAADAAGAGAFGLGAGGGAADAASALPSWMTGGSIFDSGGAAADLGAGAGSNAFSDVAASGGLGQTTAFESGAPAANLGGGSAFTPGAGIQGADISALDPTASGLGSSADEAALGAGAPGAESTPTPMARPMGAGPSAADLAASEGTGTAQTTATTASTPATTPAAKVGGGNGQFLGMDVGKPNLFGVGGALLSGGLLANNLLSKNTVPGQSQVNAINSTIPQIQSTIDNVNKTAADLRASTQPLTADAQAMMSYTSKGTLPPAQQAQITAGVQAAKAQAASIMANHGLSADPMQNAQLKQQFDTIDSQAIQLQGQLASQLYQSGLQAQGAANDTQRVAAGLQQTGINAIGLTDNTYLALQKIYADQDTKQQAAIQNFAGALGKISGGGTTIKIGS